MDVCARLFRKRSFRWNRRAVNTEPQREVGGGDSGVWKGASKGGNAPIAGPFPPPGGRKGNVMERRGENGKMQVVPATNSTTHLPVRPARGAIFLRSCPPPGNPSDGGPGGTHKGPPLAVTSCRPAYGDSPPGWQRGESWKEGDKAEAVVPKGAGERRGGA